MTPEPTAAPTLLIVDDTPGNLGMAVSFLENHGYRVAVAQDGTEGLARAALVRPDLILLDVMMPDLDGFEVCRRLKTQAATAGIPVIFMTALADIEHKVAGFRAGGVDYVTKPLQIDEVLARVETHLKIHALQRQINAQNEELERKVAARTAELTTAHEALSLRSFALDRVGEAAYLVDATGHFQYVNEEACRRLDYTREQLLALGIGDIDADYPIEREPHLWTALLAELRERGSMTFETRHRTRGGEIFPVEISANLFDYGDRTYALGLARDITERKAMEEALREKESHYRGIFENVADALYLLEVTPDGRFRNLEVNPAFEKSSGMCSADLVGKCTDETVPEEMARIVDAKYRRCIEAGVPIDEEAILDLPAGRRHYHSTLVPVRDGNGRIHRIAGISRDITERKEIARKLEESREEERKHIAREIHDELGQTLTAQRLDIATLKFQFGEDDPVLAERCQRMLKIVDQAIQSVRNIATALRPAALDMGIVPALEWLVTEFRQRTGVDCRLQLDATHLALDEAQAIGLFRIVQESLTNVTRHAEARQVVIALVGDAEAYRLAIRDDGKGFTADASRPRSFGLLGIHERALMLGGTARIESTPGCGTAVVVRIPCHRP